MEVLTFQEWTWDCAVGHGHFSARVETAGYFSTLWARSVPLSTAAGDLPGPPGFESKSGMNHRRSIVRFLDAIRRSGIYNYICPGLCNLAAGNIEPFFLKTTT